MMSLSNENKIEQLKQMIKKNISRIERLESNLVFEQMEKDSSPTAMKSIIKDIKSLRDTIVEGNDQQELDIIRERSVQMKLVKQHTVRFSEGVVNDLNKIIDRYEEE